MPLWDPSDPYGLAVFRRVMLTFSLAVIVIGLLRALAVEEPRFEIFVAIAVTVFVIGAFTEPLVHRLKRRRPGAP